MAIPVFTIGIGALYLGWKYIQPEDVKIDPFSLFEPIRAQDLYIKVVADGLLHRITWTSSPISFRTTTHETLVQSLKDNGLWRDGTQIYFNDQLLEENRTLEYYGIQPNSTIRLVRTTD